MDQIGYPSYGGAMENWGLIVYSEDLVLWDPIIAGSDDQQWLVAVIAHENAHNWFGDLVTCQWWDALWLNEGFAEWVHFLGVDAVEPGFSYWDFFYPIEFQYVMTYDGTTNSHPTIKDVGTADEADFGSITYNRGSAINRFLSSVLTLDTFVRGLNTYLQENAYSSTQYDDLWVILNDLGHSEGTLAPEYEIKDIMESYMVQMNYPLLTVNYDSTAGIANLSQSRFLYDPENANPGDDYRWFVPITYTFVGDGSTDFGDNGPPGTFEGSAKNSFFMTPNDISLEIDIGASNLPVIFNLQSSAFMRVNYDADNWNRIIDQLQTDFRSINLHNRAAILNDAFALAEAGIEDYNLPLNVAQYLLNEDQYTPMAVADDILRDLIGSSNNDISAIALEDFLEGIIAGNYDIVGINENPSNSHSQNQFQRVIASASNYLRLAEFDNDAGTLFTQWTGATDPDDPTQNPFNRHIKPYVYCGAVREIGQSAVIFLQERLQNAILPQEVDALNYGISCIQTQSLADTVHYLMDPILQHPHIPLRMSPLKLLDIALERSLSETLSWLNNNFEKLQERVHSSTVNKMIVSTMETIYRKGGSTELINKLQQFKEHRDLNPRSQEFVDWAIYGIELHMERTAKYGSVIAQWVGEHLGKEYHRSPSV